MINFSIIIPAYNSAKTIGACIKSVLDQDYNNFDIWVIDGESTDDTVKIVQSYGITGRINIISEKDDGIYDAMNKGISNATGDWLYFLGSDDQLYDSNILSTINTTISHNPTSKFIYGDIITSTNVTERYANYQYDQLLARCICHQSIFYHKSLFADKLYDTKYKVCADWDFNLKTFGKNVNPVYVDKLIARFDLGGVSGNWTTHPEYLTHFSNKKIMAYKYKGGSYFLGYLAIIVSRKVLGKLLWTFQ
jgi:glycosyltransferase involved in cell wall biosynthesis